MEGSSPHLGNAARRRVLFYGALLAAVGGSVAWSTVMPGHSHSGPLDDLDAREQHYEQQLRADVTVLAGRLGERNLKVPEALHAAAAYLAERLGEAGYQVARHEFEADHRPVSNVEVEKRGAAEPAEIVLVGAHYDSVPGAPGADDNASGAAATLALARAFAHKPTARTIRFVWFVNEEAPYFGTEAMGSLVYARRCKARGEHIVAMLSLESIGYFCDAQKSQQYPFPFGLFYPPTGTFIAFVSNLNSRGLLRRAVRSFRDHARLPSEAAALPSSVPGVAWSDQWAFWQMGYPALMVTDTAPFRNPNYHTPNDRPETLDYDRMARAVAGLEFVIDEIANR